MREELCGHDGVVGGFWAERITFLNICYVLETLEMAVKRLLNICVVYCLIVQSVLFRYFISYFSLIVWFSETEKSQHGKIPLFSPTACYFLLFFLGREPIDFYCLEAPNTIGY